MEKKFKLIATSTFGLESLVSDELKRLGYKDMKVDNGKIEFEGSAEDIVKTNIWLRCADRVLLKVGEFKAETFDELFEKTKALDWGAIISENGKFPVAKISSVKSKLFSKSDSQAIVKKAIVESLKKSYKTAILPETGSMYEVRVSILKDIVTISIDTSGDALHKRGYRAIINEAPIKETLAAAMVKLAKWRYDTPLVDPMCGTGTILIEAAMIARNIAPGSNRKFVAETWGIIPKNLWTDIRDEAYTLEIDRKIEVIGYDIDAETCKIAMKNIENAGVEEYITIKSQPLSEFYSEKDSGTIICNPPYGERLSEKEETEKLYREMGKIFRNEVGNWNYFIITSNHDFEKYFAKRSTKNRKLFNGGLECYYYQYINQKPGA